MECGGGEDESVGVGSRKVGSHAMKQGVFGMDWGRKGS